MQHQLDLTTLGFNFAKDLAIQLITLSTGLLALSVTFTKEILKTISGARALALRFSWGIHMFSILGGVWTLMALTGTLMPRQVSTPSTPVEFGSNVRIPAAGQVTLFLLGTLLLLFVYGGGEAKPREGEFQVIVQSPDQLGGALKNLKAEQWEPVSFSAQDPTRVVVLLKRSR